MTIAVIGAGLAGLGCARELADRGRAVCVIDKGRGVGGRASTRRDDRGWFDHGAARFELGLPELAAWRARWETAGVIAPWQGAWIGVPGASALPAYLATGLDVRTGYRVTALVRTAEGWQLACEGGAPLGSFTQVVLAAPAPQTQALLATAAITAFDDALATVTFAPCLAAMIVARVATELDELALSEGPLAMAYRMDRRPGRPASASQAWVLHGRDEWSAGWLEEDPEQTAAGLAAAFERALGAEVLAQRGHRWRFARATRRIAAPYLLERALGVGLAGDWFEPAAAPASARAILSGQALAAALLGA